MLLILRSDIRSIIGFSKLSNTDSVCIHVHQNRQFLKSMYLYYVLTVPYEVKSKLPAHSASLINMVTVYRKQLKLMHEDVSRKNVIQTNKSNEK